MLWRYIFIASKVSSHLYQAPPRKVAYVLQQPLKEELEQVQKQQIIVLLGVDNTSVVQQFCFSTQS